MTEDKIATYEGSISYTARLPNISWQQFNFHMGTAPVTGVNVSTNEEGTILTIQVLVVGVADFKQARAFTDVCAAQVVKRLAYNLNMFIEEPGYAGGEITVTQADGSSAKRVSAVLAGIRLFATAKCWVRLGEEATRALQQQIGTAFLRGERHYDLYRSLMSVTDSIAKFLALYLVLMSFHNDSQRNVEAFIRRCEPDVLLEFTDPPRPGKPAWTEQAVYTRLRNQIGHNRNKFLRETEGEMRSRMTGSMALVKTCSEEYG